MVNQTASHFKLLSLPLLAFFLAVGAGAAEADTSHARIIRLSYLQGDVRIAHKVKGDLLQSSDASWERASLNLPIHQGDAVATDNGRAEIEFESGNIAFLAENTILEFYDLSLEDGFFTTRLIVRQGTASFYVRPARGDYFSVTGGDFSVEAEEKAHFRLNNYDDGSDVQVLQGRVSVLNRDKARAVTKGQSLSMHAGDEASIALGEAASTDDFDQWAAARAEASQAALTASQHYSGVYDYTSGFGDLYTFGGWYNVSGFGYCWRPYGVSLAWNPFQLGRWYFDPFLGGWVFIGTQPWGWLPYHYGGWIFQSGIGWVWTPTGAFPSPRRGPFPHSQPNPWKPVTATWVHSSGRVGLVPNHPQDERGKSPVNMREGIFPVSRGGVSERIQVTQSERWKNLKNPARDTLAMETMSATPPPRVVRSIGAGGSQPGVAIADLARGSGSAQDSAHRQIALGNAGEKSSNLRRGTELSSNRSGSAASSRNTLPPSARSTPPPAPRSSGSGRDSGWGGNSSRSSSSSSRTSPGGSSGRSPSSGSSSRPSAPRTTGSSGGRPH